MLDQSFSESSFVKLVTISDMIRHGLRNKKEVEDACRKAAEETRAEDFRISKFKLKGDIYSVDNNITDFLTLKKLNRNLIRLFKIKQSNRHLIVNQVRVLLAEKTPMSIIRLDIEKFYESINREEVLKKVLNDYLLSYKSKNILRSLFENDQLKNQQGLPRGINISATLSELYMREVDAKIKQLNGVYYYGRYVDDIIIFCYSDPMPLVDEIKEILKVFTGLKLNNNKTKICTRKECECGRTSKCTNPIELSFEYLGYKFSFSSASCVDNLKIGLAKSKCKKIKSRLVKSFLEYFKNRNFDLLLRRIQIITGNFPIKINENGYLYSGIYYNYPLIDDFDSLDELTCFLRSIIKSRKSKFGSKVYNTLRPLEKRHLFKYNFKAGFKNISKHKVEPEELKELKRCW